MTATAEQLTSKLTDNALKVEVAKLGRMITNRETDRDELDNEIGELRKKRDALLEVQITRLKAQMSVTEEGTKEI